MNQQIDQKQVKQVLIDKALHKYLKVLSATKQETIRGLVEASVLECYGKDIKKLSKEGK